MKKAFLIVLGSIAALIALFAVVVAMQPSEYSVERSATMAAPPDAVFGHVNDFRRWNDWSPWAKLDPNAENSFEGPDEGEGAIFRWSGNDEVGEGNMTILESRPNESIRIQLAFIKPFEGQADVGFTFEPQGDDTLVTWSMHGENSFIEKAFCMFMDMDAMIGRDYEQGLANMKEIVEAPPAVTESAESQPAEENATE